MSRPLRIEYPDVWYHMKNRGRRSEGILRTENVLLMQGRSSSKEQIRVKFMSLMNRVEVSELKALVAVADKVISNVCEYYNVTKKALKRAGIC